MTPQTPWVNELLRWYNRAKRDLPWRRTNDPYTVWISEIMLQQTRVEAVIAYYKRFLALFPDVHALAKAPLENVLKAWEGLGYYSRARNLHETAKIVSHSLQGEFPNHYEELRKLPGIGEYTAGAIASISFSEPVPAIDGNVKRVISRLSGIRENINRPAVLSAMRTQLIHAIPEGKANPFNQALMELGAMICIPRAPRCELCQLTDFCDAYLAGDAPLLPVIDRKKPPVEVSIAVCLMTYQNTILVFKRNERLLQGLYVFGLAEHMVTPDAARSYWEEHGLSLQFTANIGEAKHIFTHRIWNMNLMHFSLTAPASQEYLDQYDAQMVDASQLKTLPLPTAMKAAKEAALKLVK